jgi:HK97 family phage portal protein
MAFLRSFNTHDQQGFVAPDKKQFYAPSGGPGRPLKPYKDGWDMERSVTQALDRVTWVYKAVYAIAANAASLPIAIRKGDWRIGELTYDDPILQIMNRNANPGQDAFSFRFMLSSQLLLSQRGAFVEIIRNRMGEVAALVLLPPQYTFPIPDPDLFVSGFSVEYPNTPKRIIDSKDVIWARVPHPIDPFKGQTPLESAGLAIEYDYYAKVFNRNFMVNDGRPGGILVINGDMEEEQAEEIQRRFKGSTGSNIGGAGRLTVMSAEDAKFIDTSTSQRDAQYIEARQMNKEEILLAFGVPESVIGNASNRTFANADVELEVFWRETMVPHLTLLERAFDKLDEDPKTYFAYDLSSVAILSRDDRERARFHLEELKQGAISIDEYRELTGREGVGIDELLIPTNLSPVVMQTSTGGQQAPEDGAPLNPNQRPGRRPADAPDPALPNSTPNSRPNDSIEPTNPPTPRPIFTPPLTPLAHDIEESKSSEDIGVRRTRQITRLEQSVALQIGSMLKRQERVTIEKAASKKVKEKWDSGEGIKAEDIFDVAVWNDQLISDAKTWVASVFLDGAIEVASTKVDSLNPGNVTMDEIVSPRIKAISSINETSKRNIEKIISEHRSKSHQEFITALKAWFASAFSSRVKTISKTEVGGAFNAGLLWAAKELGYTKKTWVHRPSQDSARNEHAELASQTVGIDEKFEINGKSAMYPGDPEAPTEFVMNCSCTLLFS